jgi:thiazole synthase
MLDLYGEAFRSRLLLGTALFMSPEIMRRSLAASGAEIVTVSLRRESGLRVLPNTAGCHTVKEAVTTAQMGRELFDTPWVKLEVIANDDTLQPDVLGLVEAARILCGEGFQIFPYCTEDLSVAERLLDAGCRVLMPWAAPIGTGRGLINPYGLRSLRAYFPGATLIVDAGLGAPSHAAEALELGFDAVLLNTAVSKARDPVRMAEAFAHAVEAGRLAFEAGLMPPRDMASPSTPLAGLPFLDSGHAA